MLLLLLALADAVAQPAPAGRKPAPAPPAAETPLSACAAANRAALNDLSQAVQAGQRRNVTNPMVVTRLQALQSQLGKLRDALPRSSRTLPECEQAAEAIAAEKERLLKIAGADPEVGDCVGNAQRVHAALTQTYDAVQRSGRLPADQQAAFEASGTRLNQASIALARDSVLAAECRQVGEIVQQERARIEGWATATGVAVAAVAPAPPPAAVAAAVPATAAEPAPAPPAAPAAQPAVDPAQAAAAAQACRDEQTRTYNQLAQSLAAAGQGAPLAADKLPHFQALVDRLTRLRTLIGDRNAAGWDCTQVNLALAQARSELQLLSR